MAARFISSHVALPIVSSGAAADLDNFWAGGGSISSWIFLDSFGATDAGRICAKENDTSTLGWGWVVDGSSDRLAFFYSFSSDDGVWVSATNSLVVNTWHHVVVTWDRTAADPVIYIDGQSVTVTTIQGPTGTPDSDASFVVSIGNRIDGLRSFDGLISDLRFYDTELTADEVQSIYALRGADDIVRALLRRWPLSPHVPGLSANTPYSGQTQVSNASASSVTVSVPSETVDGDLLVIVGFAGGTSGTAPTFTTPSGWSARTYLALPSTTDTPAMRVFTRPASSEPASYSLVASQTSPMIAYMFSLPGVTDSVDVAATATGTSATPSTPTATPTENVVALRIMAHDDDTDAPARLWDAHPQDVKALSSAIESGGGSDGGGLYVAIQCWDGTATGAKAWSLDASEEWGGITICFPYGDGIEGLPLKDLSNAQDHTVSFGHVVMDLDELAIEGG